MPTSSATATWTGGLKGGNGAYKARSDAFEGQYSFATRFEGAKGTTPEELIAAAHASCFSMALAAALERSGTPPERITTNASCTLESGEGGARITKMRLEVSGVVPGLDQAGFSTAAESAKINCPVSKALAGNLTFELAAKLET